MTGGSEEAVAAAQAVTTAARAAHAGAQVLRQMPDDALDEALGAIAARLERQSAEVTGANAEDIRAARAEGLADAFVDRLMLDGDRIRAISGQLHALARVPAEPAQFHVRDLPGDLELRERSVDASRALLAGQVQPDLYEWAAHTIVDYLVEAVLNWLEYGRPARDEEFVGLATAGARAGIRAWVSA